MASASNSTHPVSAKRRNLLLAALLLAPAALAQGRALPLTWDSATTAAGQQEVQAWATARLVRGVDSVEQSYTGVDARLWLVRGFSSSEVLFGLDLGLENTGLDTRQVDARFTGAWHQRLLEPSGLVGLSLLGRASVGVDVLDLELRAIADKSLGPLLLALNAALVRSTFWSGRSGVDTVLEQNLGVRYALPNGVSTGVEVLVRESFVGRGFEGTAAYLGPSFTYSGEAFWLTAGIYAQVVADKAKADYATPEPLEIRHNERFMFRLAVGPKVK